VHLSLQLADCSEALASGRATKKDRQTFQQPTVLLCHLPLERLPAWRFPHETNPHFVLTLEDAGDGVKRACIACLQPSSEAK